MSQKFTLYEDLTVGENLEFTASLRKIDPKKFRKRSTELLDFISFKKPLNTMVHDLPGGMRQQVSLAAAMIHDPEIVFLDEPTAGVNAASRALFWDLIRRLAREGKTIFVTSHYMDEVEQCNRIALMRSGKIIALDTPSGLKRSTFPHGLYAVNLTPPQLERLKASKVFKSVVPYGLQYHLVVSDTERFIQLKNEVSNQIEFRPIQPNLEDVFIELVEAQRG